MLKIVMLHVLLINAVIVKSRCLLLPSV